MRLHVWLFFFNESATTYIYTYGHTLSLHAALPILSIVMLFWLRRLPETLAPPDVRPLDFKTMVAGWATVTRHRRAAGYMIASGMMQRSEEHTSELQSLMRSSYAVFCLKKKTKLTNESQQIDCKLTNIK